MKRKDETAFFLDKNVLGQSCVEGLKNAGVRVEAYLSTGDGGRFQAGVDGNCS